MSDVEQTVDKFCYPEDYNDEDKADYDSLISQGLNLIGKKIKPDNEFLLHLAAKITINKKKGFTNGLNQDEIDQLKDHHKNLSNTSNIFETPDDIYYDGLLHLSDGTSFPHPLATPPKNVADPPDVYENE
jgi:hypothetical protein